MKFNTHKKGLSQSPGSWDVFAELNNIKARRPEPYAPAWRCGWFQGEDVTLGEVAVFS